MTILKEYLNYNQAGMVVENSDETTPDGKKKLFLQGVMIVGDERNLNQRIYPVSEIKNAIVQMSKTIEEHGWIGAELDHPQELTINLDRISHGITKVWMEGNKGYGKMQILSTPMGNIARTLIESGMKLGVSSRGSGEVDERGYVRDFQIITVDIVATPSAPGAYPKPVYESLNTRRGRIIEDLAKSASHDPKAMTYLQKEMLKAIHNLKF